MKQTTLAAWVLVALSPAFMAQGCPVASGYFTIPEVCKIIPDIAVPGGGVFGGVEVSNATVEYNLNLAEHLPGAVLDSDGQVVDYRFEAYLLSMEVLPKMGIESFGFVDRLACTVRPVDGSESMLNEATVGNYVRNAANPDPQSLDVVVSGDFNAVDYLRAGELTLRLSFTGRVPTDPFTIDLRVCFQIGVSGDVTP